MLLSVLTPLADLRSFTTDHAGRLRRPNWSLPNPDEFVRSLGPLRARKLGGGDEFLREAWFCDATRTVSRALVVGSRSGVSGSSTLYSRLYFDGLRAVETHGGDETPQLSGEEAAVDGLAGGMTGKFETGLVFRGSRLSRRGAGDLAALIKGVAATPVKLQQHGRSKALVRLGKPLAKFLENQTSRLQGGRPIAQPSGLVIPGEPLVVCHLNAGEGLVIPANAVQLPTPRGTRHHIHHWRYNTDGASQRVWFLVDQGHGYRSASRILRLYLMRLHVEHEALRALVRNIDHPLVQDADQAARDRLQLCIRDGLRRIARFSKLSSELAGHEMGEVGRWADHMVRPEDRRVLVDHLEALRVRPNILRQLLDYAGEDIQLSYLKDLRSLSVTRNTTTITGDNATVQQAGANSTLNAMVQNIREEGGLDEQLAALTALLEEAKANLSPADAAASAKSLAHLRTELGTPDAAPDKALVLKALDKIGDVATVAGKYAAPIGIVVGLIRKLTGL